MEKKDYGDKKTELLMKVARMYYEDSMSQEEIAERNCLFQTVCIQTSDGCKRDGNRPVQGCASKGV